MFRLPRGQSWVPIAGVAVVAAGMLTAQYGQAHGRHDNERHLFVWAGDQARTQPDFLAVVDFDPASNHYGRVVNSVPLPGPGAVGNEPHHVGLSSDGRTLGGAW